MSRCDSVEEASELLVALHYEQKVRIADKRKYIELLRSCLDKQTASFKTAESIIKRSTILLL